VPKRFAEPLGSITEVPDFAKVDRQPKKAGSTVTVGDVALRSKTVKEPRSLSRGDNKNAGSSGRAASNRAENTIESRSRQRTFEAIKGTLPPGVEVIFTRDASKVYPRAGPHVQSIWCLGGCIGARNRRYFSSASIRSTISGGRDYSLGISTYR